MPPRVPLVRGGWLESFLQQTHGAPAHIVDTSSLEHTHETGCWVVRTGGAAHLHALILLAS